MAYITIKTNMDEGPIMSGPTSVPYSRPPDSDLLAHVIGCRSPSRSLRGLAIVRSPGPSWPLCPRAPCLRGT